MSENLCKSCGIKKAVTLDGYCEDCKASKMEVEVKVNRNEEIEVLREKNEDLKTKLELIAQKEFDRRVTEAEHKAEALGIDVPFIESPEQLKLIEAQIREKESSSGSAPSGTAPLNRTVYGERIRAPSEGYESYEAMLSDLRKREAQGDRQAKAILNEFWKKAVWNKSPRAKLEILREVENVHKNIKEDE